jgi:hypothetical protein
LVAKLCTASWPATFLALLLAGQQCRWLGEVLARYDVKYEIFEKKPRAFIVIVSSPSGRL